MRIAVESRIAELTPVQRSLLLERRPTNEIALREGVRILLERVRSQGDDALFEMARELDGVDLARLEVPSDEWRVALEAMPKPTRRAWKRAARNIEVFHLAQVPNELTVDVEPGLRLGRRAAPVSAAGVYAPGGRAAYPSSVLMGVVPARAAGVEEIIVCSPPGPSGAPPRDVLAACAISGATRLFALGGAGAIGAMAYGTGTVPRVDVVVGPGNKWVTEAKRQVAGDIRIDSPAGPSEVLVVADSSADASRVASELMAQAEHDPEAAVAVVGWEAGVLVEVRRELEKQLELAPRRPIIEAALASRGAYLLASDRGEALSFAREYAAEHLALFITEAGEEIGNQHTAGTIFLGDSSSVAFGDYMTGANHVLPTAGLARAFSGLSSLDFMRFYTWQEVSSDAAAALSEDVQRLAEAEGLPAHAAAARARAVSAGGEPTGEGRS